MTINRITKLAEKQKSLEQKIIKLEEQLKTTKATLRGISESELPEAMDEEGLEKFTLKSGGEVAIKDEMFASLAKKNHEEIAAWLRKVDAESLIKHTVGVEFGKGQDNLAGDLNGSLQKKFPENAFDKISIHTGSVKALVREMLSEGKKIPMELLGVSMLRRAVLTSSGR